MSKTSLSKTDAHTIRCPLCGAGTTVTETRLAAGGLRRRRRCRHRECAGRVTTYELVADAPRALGRSGSPPLFVPSAQLDRVIELLESWRTATSGGDE